MQNRLAVFDGGLQRPQRAGDSPLLGLIPNVISADANATLTVANISGGAVVFTGFTAGRNLTLDTAANYLAAFPWMDIGDSITIVLSITTAFAGTLVTATGMTLAGRAAVPASSTCSLLTLTRTGAATMTALLH